MSLPLWFFYFYWPCTNSTHPFSLSRVSSLVSKLQSRVIFLARTICFSSHRCCHLPSTENFSGQTPTIWTACSQSTYPQSFSLNRWSIYQIFSTQFFSLSSTAPCMATCPAKSPVTVYISAVPPHSLPGSVRISLTQPAVDVFLWTHCFLGTVCHD